MSWTGVGMLVALAIGIAYGVYTICTHNWSDTKNKWCVTGGAILFAVCVWFVSIIMTTSGFRSTVRDYVDTTPPTPTNADPERHYSQAGNKVTLNPVEGYEWVMKTPGEDAKFAATGPDNALEIEDGKPLTLNFQNADGKTGNAVELTAE